MTIAIGDSSHTRPVERRQYRGYELRPLIHQALELVDTGARVAWLHVDRSAPASAPAQPEECSGRQSSS